MLEYRDLELGLSSEADAVASKGDAWTADEVARKLREISDLLARIRQKHQTGINASMGKRSGTGPEDI